MNPPLNPATLSLELLVEQTIERLQAGEALDLGELVGSRADLFPQLEAMLPTLQALAKLEQREPQEQSGWVGRQLGDFRLLREIGRGGMGIVFAAVQLSLSRCVAVKVLPHASLLPQRARQRFEREAHAASLLSHPHIVPIFGFGCEDGLHYYAMQFIDGENLAEVIHRRQSANATVADALSTEESGSLAPQEISNLSPSPQYSGESAGVRGGNPNAARVAGVLYSIPGSERSANSNDRVLSTKLSHPETPGDWFRRVAEIGRQVALGLHHAHEAGVIHRDIKPANLLLDRDGNAWIADFGLARCDKGDGLTLTGDLPGTLRYMSPEQMLGDREPIDRRTDIYSLGATLWELAALRPLHDGASRSALTRQSEVTRPPSLRKACRGAPRDLDMILQKALAKNRDERYATALEMAEDLAAFLRGERVRRGTSPISRRLVLGGSVAALMTMGVFLGTRPGRRVPARTAPAIDTAFRWQIYAVPEPKSFNSERGLHLGLSGPLQNGSFVILRSGNAKYRGADIRALDVGSPSKGFAVQLVAHPVSHGYIWRVVAPDRPFPAPLRHGDTVVFRSENNNFRNDRSGRHLEASSSDSTSPPTLKISEVRDNPAYLPSEKWRIIRVAGEGEVRSQEPVYLESVLDLERASRWLHGDGDPWQPATLSLGTIEQASLDAGRQTRSVALEASGHAQIHQKYGDENNVEDLAMREAPPVYAAVKFDLTPILGADVRRAKVRVEWKSVTIATRIMVAAFQGADWNERSVTWNKMNDGRDPGKRASALLDTVDIPAIGMNQQGRFSEWDVTSAVSGWLDGSVVNSGLLFMAPKSGSVAMSFWGRHQLDGTHGPKLIVEVAI